MSGANYLRRVRDDDILSASGRQLATESGATVTTQSDNWWAEFRYHYTSSVL